MRPGHLFEPFRVLAAGLIPRIKASMQSSLAESNLSREQVLDRMNNISAATGVKLNGGSAKALHLATLEKWLNPNDRDHVPSVLALNVFCAAVESYAPLAAQLEAHGLTIMNAEERRERDYGRACMALKEARRKKRQLETEF